MSVNLGRVTSGPNYKPYIILFIIASLGVIGFVIHTSLARATITLNAKKDITRGTARINVSPDATGNLAAFNAVNGQIISKKVTTTKTFSQVEKKEIDSYASGVVTLYNERSEEQPLVANTQLLSDNGVLFKTQERVVIPPDGSVTVNVRAAEKGTAGNIGPTHFIIAKLWENWQDLIYGKSLEAMTGGRVNDFVVTEETLEKAKQDSALQIANDIVEEIAATLPEDEAITRDSVMVEITRYTPNVTDGDIAKSFEAEVHANVTAVTFNKNLIKTIAEEKIREDISESKDILSLDTNSFTYTLNSVDTEKQSALLDVSIAAETINAIPQKALEKHNLVGRNNGDVIAYYKQFDEVDTASASFSPFWVQNVPANESSIEIVIE